MAVVALIIHFKNKLVDVKRTWVLAFIGCVFSLFGAIIANNIDNGILKKLFAIFLIGLGVWQLIELIREKNKSN